MAVTEEDGTIATPKPNRTQRSAPSLAQPITVNGVTIPRRAIAAEVQNFPARSPGQAWRQAARALVVREVLLQEARRLRVPVRQETDESGCVETVEDSLIRALVEREVHVPRTDAESLHRYYENNCGRFVTAPLYEADHILFAARRDDAGSFTAARERASAMSAVLAGEPERFAALAREHSDCPSAAVGGCLGQIGPGDTTPEFEKALAGLSQGGTSGPVETRYGFHLIRLRQRIEGRQLPFDAVRERIVAYLEQHVRRKATAQYIAVLIGRADIGGIAIEGATSPLVQ